MIIGIDLGTTNSLAAIWRDGKASIIPNALGEHLTPSCVSIDDDGTVLVGRAARERLQTHPQLTAAVFKRYMGSENHARHAAIPPGRAVVDGAARAEGRCRSLFGPQGRGSHHHRARVFQRCAAQGHAHRRWSAC